MLSLSDKKWVTLCGGYGTPVDIRPLLRALEEAKAPGDVWDSLWNELYHQGDVSEGSYAAIPHLVRIYQECNRMDWNVYALTASIELARTRGNGPSVPSWTLQSYEDALNTLGVIGLQQLMQASDRLTIRSILGFVAMVRGLTDDARLLIELDEDEVREIIQEL